MKNKTTKDVYIYGGQRTPFVRSFTKYMGISNQQLATASIQHLSTKFGLKGELIGDVAMGSVIGHTIDWNMTREAVLGTDLHPETSAYNVQRACGTGLETLWHLAMKISLGQIESGIGGGSDTNSDLPVVFPKSFGQKMLGLRGAKSFGQKVGGFFKFTLADVKPQFPGVMEPRTGMSMGQHCEKMVQEWGISQREQDEIAYRSHMNAAAAMKEGFLDDLVFEFNGVKQDTSVRGDTTLEKLAKLKPAFDFGGKGTLTAGNSSPLTDGAAVTLIGSKEFGDRKGLKPLARFVDFQVNSVDFVHGAGLLMAPTIAVSEMLKRNNMKLQDFDFYEIHEAFAGQVACTLKAWESKDYCQKVLKRADVMGSIDLSKMNVKGGSVAVGHPFAATGSRITAGLAKMLSQKSGRGLISICTAGGMGVTAILESV
ncbi:MAG: acetyl-CoA C-acetyltransferase [Bdellovibrionota bacterium]